MMTLRLAHERGHAHHGWLDSWHTFSFADYYDPQHMGVSVLRVINDDRVQPGSGFDTHPHRNMEIISYILEGAIEHKDSMGSHTTLRAGEVQVMSAGTGVAHSEYNPSRTGELHFLQIWVQPRVTGIAPSYDQKDFSAVRGIQLIVSPDGRDGSLQIHQDVYLHKVLLEEETRHFPLAGERTYYLHVARGKLEINGQEMSAGDSATITGETLLELAGHSQVEALLFDLP